MDCMLNRRIVSGGAGGGGLEPATLTITSTDYTGEKYMSIAWTKPDGTIGTQNSYEAFTFPITIDTVVNGGVVVSPDGFSGIPNWKNPSGCAEAHVTGYTRYILVTNSAASIEVYDAD